MHAFIVVLASGAITGNIDMQIGPKI